MSWRHAMSAVKSFLTSTTGISMAGGLLTTGIYVAYKDQRRYPRMMEAYARGQILPPLSENSFEVVYHNRPELEINMRRLLEPIFSNEYYLVEGEVGAGKSRTLVELVRSLIEENGREGKGAPVYVLVSQGKSFAETLGEAVGFNFDEHISFSFFFDFVMRIHSLPHRDDANRLIRVLDAIEKSAFRYMKKYGRPAVIVIDGVNDLPEQTLMSLMEKAKLWADTNVVKLVFVNNDEEVELFFQKHSSHYSRAAPPIFVGELSREESIQFLGSPRFMENQPTSPKFSMPRDEAERVYELLGGLVHLLIVFKRDWIRGMPFEQNAEEFKDREREKFLHVSRSPMSWNIISLLRSAPNNSILMSKLIRDTNISDVEALARQNIIKYVREPSGIVVTFQSTLTKNVVDDLETAYGKLAQSAKD